MIWLSLVKASMRVTGSLRESSLSLRTFRQRQLFGVDLDKTVWRINKRRQWRRFTGKKRARSPAKVRVFRAVSSVWGIKAASLLTEQKQYSGTLIFSATFHNVLACAVNRACSYQPVCKLRLEFNRRSVRRRGNGTDHLTRIWRYTERKARMSGLCDFTGISHRDPWRHCGDAHHNKVTIYKNVDHKNVLDLMGGKKINKFLQKCLLSYKNVHFLLF